MDHQSTAVCYDEGTPVVGAFRIHENFSTDYHRLKADFPPIEAFADPIRMHGDLSDGDDAYAKLLARSPAFRRLHDWVYGGGMATFLLDLYRSEIEAHLRSGELLLNPFSLRFNSYHREGLGGRPRVDAQGEAPTLFGRLDLGYGIEGYGRVNGGHGIHTDNSPRLFSTIWYFCDHSDFEGGEFNIWKLRSLPPRFSLVRRIPVHENLAVSSLQTNDALHSASEVTRIVRQPRFAAYMAVSCTKPLWCRPSYLRRIATKNRNENAQRPHVRALRRVMSLAIRT